MELYFLRHGQSVPSSDWTEDQEKRPLTEESVSALAHEVWALARMGVRPDVVITSPVERAQQTAEIVASGLGLEDRLRTEQCLGKGFGMKQLRRILRKHSRAASIMLVGHNPEFATTIHKLTGGHVVLGKGGLARVHLAARKSRSAELVWLLQAGDLAGLGTGPSSPVPEASPDDAGNSGD
jgi:phosphohistidine phosphatase